MDDSSSHRPREDLCNRYQDVVEIQTKSIRNFDDKTWRVMRVTGLIVGIGIAALSYGGNIGNGLEILSQRPIQITLSISLLFFLGSFGLGIRSYKSAEFSTAPNTELGNVIKDEMPDPEEYQSTVVESYVTAIEANNTTLSNKKDRFRLTLASLFIGIWSLGVAIMLGIWTPNCPYAYVAAGLLSGGIVGYCSLYPNPLYRSQKVDGEPER
ncbi:hypothetical protein [Natronobiforma cellulositropha]|uniref:hypothetical protein n=1 Tax=Natronobiforma cellulositropha TaxID=1679076 RepID=UPI0021D573F9|nr:hypothetical protein [Natronobiforma cellulositropha]